MAGRWASRDPIGETGGENLYLFLKNNGVGWIDYLGMRGRASSAVCEQKLRAAMGDPKIAELMKEFDSDCPLDISCECCGNNPDVSSIANGWSGGGKTRICWYRTRDMNDHDFENLVWEELSHRLQECGKLDSRPDYPPFPRLGPPYSQEFDTQQYSVQLVFRKCRCKEINAKSGWPNSNPDPDFNRGDVIGGAVGSCSKEMVAAGFNLLSAFEYADKLFDRCSQRIIR